MTKPKNYRFHKTGQYRNAVSTVIHKVKYKGMDEEGNPIIDELAQMPKINYTGTVKLHGTNASIVLHEDGTVSLHSKSQLLGFFAPETGDFTLKSDNAEFAQSMERRKDGVAEIGQAALRLCHDLFNENHEGIPFPIKISGEWCGSGIQSGVGISHLHNKSLFIFGIRVGDPEDPNSPGWLEQHDIAHIDSEEHHIYNIMSFTEYGLQVDFASPAFAQNDLVAWTKEVEDECPVSRSMKDRGLLDKDAPTLLGEGIVWIPNNANDENWYSDSGTWFKTKGEKHSVSKVKSVAAIDPEVLNSIEEFVKYSVTEARLEQGLQEVGLDQKKVGAFIGWVNKDINSEEGDTLEANNLTMRDVGKYIANKSRHFYLGKLNAV